ncbi:YXWGXW repeat-containing protein [Myxococcus vastator]|uniref:YXWGXW repeat-containing protein n=1 Tax=Myxococcus vastator TaxID=2709664 RepID=UPI0013D704BE|nr:YXWGXW repeat-containing protein [Myxococcus vastator]
MTPRWWACLVTLLAAPMVHAQTAPVPASEPGYSEYAYDDTEFEDEDTAPMAPSAPPQLPAENASARPFAGAVWASGHWYWDGNEWRFNAGTWLAPMDGYRFINGYWEPDGRMWRWVSGGWARHDSPVVEIPIAVASEELTTQQAPPPLRVEHAPTPPAPSYVWTPGYWYWAGANYVWVGGMWAAPPRPGLVYVSSRWVRRGPSWYFSAGGWANRGSVRVTVPVYRHAHVTVARRHPHYFTHTWRRYPAVRHHVYRPGYNYRRGPSPVRHHYRGNNGYRRGNGNYHRASPGGNGGRHGGSPGGGHRRGDGGRRGGRD